MAVEFIQAVWELSPYAAEKIVVQLACADWADARGFFFPSLDEIAQKARITKRGAIKIFEQMKRDGEIIVVSSNRGRGKRNSYKFGARYQEAVLEIRAHWKAKREGLKGEPRSPFRGQKGEPRSPFTKTIKGERGSIKGERGSTCKDNRHDNRHDIGTNTIFSPAADAEKMGVSDQDFQIPTLAEFTERFFDTKLTAWCEKFCPSIMPQVATSEFLHHHQSEATQFQTETAFIRAWRGWMRNAEKIQQSRADNRARKGNSHAKSNSDGFDQVDWEGLRLAGIIN